MSRTLKWVLGILAVLIVLAIAAGSVWMWQNRAQLMASNRPYAVQPGAPNNQQPYGFGQRGFGDDGRGPMMGPWAYGGHMMGGRGRFGGAGIFGLGLFFVGGLFRLLVPLALFAIVALVFYQLGRRAPRPVTASTPAAAEAPKNE